MFPCNVIFHCAMTLGCPPSCPRWSIFESVFPKHCEVCLAHHASHCSGNCCNSMRKCNCPECFFYPDVWSTSGNCSIFTSCMWLFLWLCAGQDAWNWHIIFTNHLYWGWNAGNNNTTKGWVSMEKQLLFIPFAKLIILIVVLGLWNLVNLGWIRCIFFLVLSRISVLFSVIMFQNSVLGVVLATQHFGNPLTAVPCAVSSVCHSIFGSVLAGIWRRTVPKTVQDWTVLQKLQIGFHGVPCSPFTGSIQQ